MNIKGAGKKLDNDKPRWDLMPFAELDEVASVLEFGAKKYSENNWKLVKEGKARYLAAALRHISKIAQGEFEDQETGLSHYSHAVCSLLFAHWHHKKSGRIIK